jgi:hypothetical protein
VPSTATQIDKIINFDIDRMETNEINLDMKHEPINEMINMNEQIEESDNTDVVEDMNITYAQDIQIEIDESSNFLVRQKI